MAKEVVEFVKPFGPMILKAKLPEVPQKGDLDINKLRESKFFFA